MKFKLLFFLITISLSSYTQEKDIKKICKHLLELNFTESKLLINKLPEKDIKIELKALSQVLYNSGQYKTKDSVLINSLTKKELSQNNLSIRYLTKAYYDLFYHRREEKTYLSIDKSYILSRKVNNEYYQKLSLLAFLNYYARENTLDKKSFLFFLKEYQKLAKTISDEMWIVFYKNLYEGRSALGTSKSFKRLGEENVEFLKKNSLYLTDGLKSNLYENIGVYYRVFNLPDSAKFFFNKTICLPSYPYLQENKFIANLGLGKIAASENNISSAKEYFKSAKKNINRGDTIKSLVSYNKFKANYYHFPNKEYDSAYLYINKSFNLNRVINYEGSIAKTAEVNVKSRTSQKEQENQQLKKDKKNLLIGSFIFLILGSIITILIYKNTKRKQRIAEQEREIEIQKTEKLLKEKEITAIKTEKLLKEQELTAIDAMISGQEKERQRLANDLHDNLGSTLATVKLHFEHLKNNRNNPKVENIEELYSKTNNLLDEAYQKVRTIAHEKNSGVMAKQGLLPAVKNLAKKASNGDGLKIEVQDYGLDERLDNALEISIFRMIQELITNTIKHANASEINISLTNHDSLLNIIVEDNGKGFNAKILPDKDGMGLKSIEKRIEHMEGTFEIDSTIGKGTNIIINIPI